MRAGKFCHVRVWVYHLLMHFKVHLLAALAVALDADLHSQGDGSNSSSSSSPAACTAPASPSAALRIVDRFADEHAALVRAWQRRHAAVLEVATATVAMIGSSAWGGGGGSGSGGGFGAGGFDGMMHTLRTLTLAPGDDALGALAAFM